MNTTLETLELFKAALAKGADASEISKSITTGTGLVAYDLQAPAKNLYPVLTPLRNRVPRVGGAGGTATNWRVVQAITGSGYDASPWVPEGQRAARMSYTTANKAASYVTIGEEDQISYEARNAANGFENLQATMTMRLLQKMMLKEEDAILGGNASVALGTPTAPTVSNAASGGGVAAGTYNVAVVALTYEGLRNSTVSATGVATSKTVTGADGATFTLNGGSSQKSSTTSTGAITGSTNAVSASTPVVNGAVAYAWYIGTAAAEKLVAITNLNSVVITALPSGSNQALSAITADNSQNSLAFDGLLSAAFVSGSGAYINALATGTAGTGTVLTSGGRGNVNEIDTMLQTMWNNYKMSPSILLFNAQEQKNVTNKVLNGSSAPLLRYTTAGTDPYAIVANGVISYYYSPYANGGAGGTIPCMIHPTLPAGTILGWCENLPAVYQSNNVPNVAEVHTRADYYQINWPLKTRAQEVGVYAEEVLAVYAPFAMGIITNIANG